MAIPTLTDPAQDHAPVVVNELFAALEYSMVYAKAYLTTSGLTWGYYGGRWGGFTVADGTLTLTASSTNYVVVEIATGVISVATTNTNWNDTANYARVYKIVTGVATVTSYEDHRAGAGGIGGGAGGGSTGFVTSLDFTASSTTTDSDPGTGILRWNNATQASATILYIDNADVDSTSLATLWASLASGAFLRITEAGNQDVWQLWNVTSTPTNGTGYYKFAVSLQAQEGGNIANATAIFLDVDAAGGAAITALTGDGTASGSGSVAFTLANTAVSAGSYKGADVTFDAKGRATAAAHGSEAMLLACSDEATAMTAGTAKLTFRMPYAFTLTAVRAGLSTAQTSGSIFTVDINESGSTILSTKLTIDNTEKTSTTAATAAVMSDTSLADDAEITIDIDQIGDGTAKGLKVTLIGHRT